MLSTIHANGIGHPVTLTSTVTISLIVLLMRDPSPVKREAGLILIRSPIILITATFSMELNALKFINQTKVNIYIMLKHLVQQITNHNL